MLGAVPIADGQGNWMWQRNTAAIKRTLYITDSFNAQQIKSYDLLVPKGHRVYFTLSNWVSSDAYGAVAFWKANSTTNQQVTTFNGDGQASIIAEDDYTKVAVWTRGAATSIDLCCAIISPNGDEILDYIDYFLPNDDNKKVLGYPIYLRGTFNGTTFKNIHTSISAGTYKLHINAITSSDTNDKVSQIRFMNASDTAVKEISLLRNIEINRTITFNEDIDHIYVYAAAGYTNSVNDTFIF